MTTYQHWQLHTETLHDSNQPPVLWLGFDRDQRRVNTINDAVLTELDTILSHIEQTNYAGVVIHSLKSSGFIAGADIHELSQNESKEAVEALLDQGQRVFKRLEKLTIPTVALMTGFCLGGGLELALACHYRIAERHAQLGLPEVKLGLHPGWGGSVRLPALVGAVKAMNLMLPGKVSSARSLAKIGVVDYALPQRQLHRATIYCVRNKPSKQHPKWHEAVTNQRWVRPLLSYIFNRKTSQQVRFDHYPSPFQLIDNWRKHGTANTAYAAEKHSFARLAQKNTAQNLVRAFFLREKMKGLAKGIDYQPQYVHVIGAGVMGGDIAAWAAMHGFNVTLQDHQPAMMGSAFQRAYQLFTKRLKSARAIQASFDRLVPDANGDGLQRADVVLEAISEKLEAKQALFKQIEPKLKADALLATNTSSLTLEALAEALDKPQRFVGLHFFNPVAKMHLVEVVHGQSSSADAIDRAKAWVRHIDRLPLPVKSSPGFLINRMLFPYLMEGIYLYQERVSPSHIDQAGEDFGMPMGPLKLADYVGLDILYHGLQIQSQHYDISVPESLKQTVEAGQLGKKTGKGYYRWWNGQSIPYTSQQTQDVPQDLQSRLIDPMLNTAVACWREGVVDDQALIDGGMIFGAGFAPFRGGPMQYLQNMGPEKIHHNLQNLVERYGERFQPDEGWQRLLSEQKEQESGG